MADKKVVKPVAIAVGTALVGSFAVTANAEIDAGASPFAITTLASGYLLGAQEGSCGEGKCGGDKEAEADKAAEGSCGGDREAEADKAAEGSCGGDKAAEGSCGGDREAEADKAAEGSCGGDKAAEGSCGGDKEPG